MAALTIDTNMINNAGLNGVLARWERKSSMQSLGVPSAATNSGCSSSAPKTPKTPKTPLSAMSFNAATGEIKAPKTPSSASCSSGAAAKTPAASDRFIPVREASTSNAAAIQLGNENAVPCKVVDEAGLVAASVAPSSSCADSTAFAGQVAETVMGENVAARGHKILAFKTKAPKPSESYQNRLRVLYTQNKAASQNGVQRSLRQISAVPERILDAPGMVDDFYLNLLEWSNSNILAVALGQSIYMWNSTTSTIHELEQKGNTDSVCSVSWTKDSSHLAVGYGCGDVKLWDVERGVSVRTMRGHAARVGALAWNEHILSSGSRDNTVHHHDVRIQAHHTHTLAGHQQEICGLKWSTDGTQLASGGNDNVVCVWDAGKSTARYSFTESQAAVKALAWCPFQANLLAAGGGTADRHIRFYNTLTGSMVNSIDTKSQVCSLQWSIHEKEILSAHGFSQNQLSVWKYPSLAKVTDLLGHESRVLHTAMSPDGTTVCSAAADESLRFWRVWTPQAQKKVAAAAPARGSLALQIR